MQSQNNRQMNTLLAIGSNHSSNVVSYLLICVSRHFLIPLQSTIKQTCLDNLGQICLYFGIVVISLLMLIMFMRIVYRAQKPVSGQDPAEILLINDIIRDSLTHFAIFVCLMYALESRSNIDSKLGIFSDIPKFAGTWFFLGRSIYIFGHILNKSVNQVIIFIGIWVNICLLYTSPSPRDLSTSRMPSSA